MSPSSSGILGFTSPVCSSSLSSLGPKGLLLRLSLHVAARRITHNRLNWLIRLSPLSLGGLNSQKLTLWDLTLRGRDS